MTDESLEECEGVAGFLEKFGLPQSGLAVRELLAEVALLKNALIQQQEEISQTLGKALGYPRYSDDLMSFPDCPPDDTSVCTGDNVAESLASEAADRIERLQAERDHCRSQWTGLLVTVLRERDGSLSYERATAQAEARVADDLRAFHEARKGGK